MPQSNKEIQQKYYKEKSFTVLRNRHLRQMKRDAEQVKKGGLQKSRPATIHKYDLVEEAKNLGLNHKIPQEHQAQSQKH